MKTCIQKIVNKNTLFFILILWDNTLFAQMQGTDILKIATKTVLESRAIKNLNREKRLHFFESSSEGLQSTAKDGRFGYMSQSYDWVIPPQYDFTFPFRDGFGVVFLKGQPSYIDKKGNIPFKTDFAKDLGDFINGRALFRTHSGKMGILNKSGQLMGDTIFKKIYLFDSESIRPRGLKRTKKNHPVTLAIGLESTPSYALIDTNGRVIVPFGTFKNISEFDNGYVTAVNDNYTALFDENGKEVLRFNTDTTRDFTFDFPIRVNHGAFVVNFKNEDKKRERQGIMSIKGEWLLNEPNVSFIHDYDDTKAFFSNHSDEKDLAYYTERIEPVILPKLHQFPDLYDLKKYGIAVASIETYDRPKVGIMDSCFAWRVKPEYDQIQLVNRDDMPHFYLHRNVSNEEAQKRNIKSKYEGSESYVVKIADITGKILLDNKEFSSIHPMNATLKTFYFTSVDGLQSGCIDTKGNITRLRDNKIEEEKSQNMQKNMSVNFAVYSREEWKIKVDDANCKGQKKIPFGEISVCNNYKKIENVPNEPKQIAEIRFSESDTFTDKTRRKKLIKAQLMNSTSDTLFFKFKENSIDIVIQAQDENGIWRNISFKRGLTPYEKEHKTENVQIGLPPQYFWEIELPLYTGLIKTKCRSLIIPDKKEAKPIVSNEWTASVNPAQFWKSPMYSPEKIFDDLGYWYESND
jgi:hypothetical protein